MRITVETDSTLGVVRLLSIIRNTKSLTLIESEGTTDLADLPPDPTPQPEPEPIPVEPLPDPPSYREKKDGHYVGRQRHGVYAGLLHHASISIQREARRIWKDEGREAAIKYLEDHRVFGPKRRNSAPKKKRTHNHRIRQGHRFTCQNPECARGFIRYVGKQRYCSKRCADRAGYLRDKAKLIMKMRLKSNPEKEA